MVKQLVAACLLATVCFCAKSQVLDTASLKDYPAAVIVRVYDVASRVSLTSSEQVTLADLFLSEEQAMKSLVMNGTSQWQIDSVKGAYTTSFQSLLTAQKLNTYYESKVLSKANTTARLTASVLREKYNTDTTFEKYFRQIYGWREVAVERLWLQHSDTVARNSNIKTAIAAYDTLLNTYIASAAGARYFAGRVFLIDSVLSIAGHRKTAMANDYHAKCMMYRYRSYADNFNTAFNTEFDKIEDTAYYAIAYKNDIDQATQTATQAALSGYFKTHAISSYTGQLITPHIIQRERGIALLNKLYPNHTGAKDSAVADILAVRQPIIDSLIGLESDPQSLSQIDIAIRFAVELDLTNSQLENLQAARTTLKAMHEEFILEDPFGEFDSSPFESEELNAILSPEQYTQVLAAKFTGKARSRAKLDWQMLVFYELYEELGIEEPEAKIELTNYHLAVLIAYYRNAHDPEEQYLSVQRINEVMPESIRSLLEIWEYRTPYGDSPDVFFQW